MTSPLLLDLLLGFESLLDSKVNALPPLPSTQIYEDLPVSGPVDVFWSAIQASADNSLGFEVVSEGCLDVRNQSIVVQMM